MNYKEALISSAQELGVHKITDVIIPRPNRIIMKSKTRETLEGMRDAIDKTAKLKYWGTVKISKQRKNRLILFGVPGEMSDDEFMGELGGSRGR